MWAVLRCFPPPSFLATSLLLFTLYLWAVKWGDQGGGRRENNCPTKAALLNWTGVLVSARLVFPREVEEIICAGRTHTHTVTNGLFLFISLLQGLRETSLIPGAHVWLLSSVIAIAPASSFVLVDLVHTQAPYVSALIPFCMQPAFACGSPATFLHLFSIFACVMFYGSGRGGERKAGPRCSL